VKRSFSEYDEDGWAEHGPEAKVLTPGNSFAMKFLFSEAEMRAIGQQGEEIQSMSGATLATTGELYPSTAFQELNIAGPNTEAVLSAAVYALAHIVQIEGAVTNGEEDVPHGEGRLRTVVPTKSAASVIGKGGANIAQIRAATNLYIHVDTAKVPPDGGVLSEQIVSLSGPLVGLQDGLAMVLEHVHEMIGEPWFAAWASSTNVGLEFPGISLELHGKGMHGGKGEAVAGGKGGSPVNINADASLGVSGEVCQFFVRSGWCRWGEECRHIHSGGPSIPITQPEQLAFPSPGGRYMQGSDAKGSGAPAVSILSAFGIRGEAPKGIGDKPIVQSVSGEVCRFFQKAGWCQRGAACWHAHVAGPDTPRDVPPTGPPPEACQFFLKTGTCKWGSSCRYIHDTSTSGQLEPGFDLNGFPVARKPPGFQAPEPTENCSSKYLE